jgi:hypothetical protein
MHQVADNSGSLAQTWPRFPVVIAALSRSGQSDFPPIFRYSSYSFQIITIASATETEQNSTTAEWGVQGRNMAGFIKFKYDPILKRVIFPSSKQGIFTLMELG